MLEDSKSPIKSKTIWMGIGEVLTGVASLFIPAVGSVVGGGVELIATGIATILLRLVTKNKVKF